MIERSSNIWLGVLYKVPPLFVLEKEDGGNSGCYWPEVLTLVISNPSKILCFLLTVVSWASMGRQISTYGYSAVTHDDVCYEADR